ncbi:MAG TPA: hypothetical protein VIV11_37265 [Kofleriaceae bacterium]
MSRAWLLALALAGCTSEDNLGNHVFGDARWSVAIGSPGQDRATALAVDPIGNVIVAGTCDGLVDFGSTRADCRGSFITRRAWDTGREEWTAVLAHATVASVHIDERGSVVVAGMQQTATGSDPFVATYDGAGVLQTIAGFGHIGTAVATAGAIEPDGCIYMTGGFHGTMPTPEGPMTNQSGQLDGYVSGHFDSGGAWTVRFGGDSDQLGRALALRGEHLSVIAQASAPLRIADQTVEAAVYPASVLLQLSILGDVQWTRALPGASEHLAVAPDSSIVVTELDAAMACTRLRGFDVAGRELWATPCVGQRSTDAIAIGVDGTIVSGGRNFDLQSGELFLAAHAADGRPLGSTSAQPYPFERDSSLDAIAIEPTGEVAFVGSVNHPFDFGNGMLSFHGMHDAVIVKLDSPSGHDGPVVLLRE